MLSLVISWQLVVSTNFSGQYILAVAPVTSFFLLLGCKWISTKRKQSPTAQNEVSEKSIDADQGIV